MADLVAMAADMVRACVAQDWDAAYENADPKFVRGFTEFMNAETWKQVRAIGGNLLDIVGAHPYRHLLAQPPVRVVFLDCKFDRLLVTVQVSFSHEHKILGLAILTPGF